jgi:hypothetical protein
MADHRKVARQALVAIDPRFNADPPVSSIAGARGRASSGMPIINVYSPADLFPVGSDRELAKRLTQAAMKTEGYSETLLERSGLTVDELTSLNERSQALRKALAECGAV